MAFALISDNIVFSFQPRARTHYIVNPLQSLTTSNLYRYDSWLRGYESHVTEWRRIGLYQPRRGSSTSLIRSFVSCTVWRLQSGLHSNNQSLCTSVYTRVRTCIPNWRALSGGRCRGSSATPFQFIFIIDRQPHPTPYRRWPSFPGRRCTCLEQSARSCHFRTFSSSLPVAA